IHLSLLGEAGLRQLAALNHQQAVKTAEALAAVPGVELLNDSFFNEFTVKLSKPAAEVTHSLAEKDILAGVPVSRLMPEDPAMANLLVVAATELTTDADISALADGLKEVLA
ncbi:MAG: glycine dehydrogenase, partial [Alphaproteobacteria bacterium]|nr:glycine dehydrogenase [Alphaproteobacteria bacterium]